MAQNKKAFLDFIDSVMDMSNFNNLARYFYKQENMKRAKELLVRYLKGKKVSFKMRLRLDDLSPFTRRVLRTVRTIPYGETRTYGWVAGEIGLAKGSRAVGQALKRNPLPIIIPCHRVIRSNGELGGFSSGVKLKKILLAKEAETVLILPAVFGKHKN